MTSIKIFRNEESKKLENDVNQFLEGYENYTTSVSVMTFMKDSSPNFLAVVSILGKIPPVNVEAANNK